jgi:hypothetical protein
MWYISDDVSVWHDGRVTDVGYDWRSTGSSEHGGAVGCIALRVQQAPPASTVQGSNGLNLDPQPGTQELILIEGDELFVLPSAVRQRGVVKMHYDFQSSAKVSTDPDPNTIAPISTYLFVRRIWNKTHKTIRPITHSHRLTGGLELEEIGKEKLDELFADDMPTVSTCISRCVQYYANCAQISPYCVWRSLIGLAFIVI